MWIIINCNKKCNFVHTHINFHIIFLYKHDINKIHIMTYPHLLHNTLLGTQSCIMPCTKKEKTHLIKYKKQAIKQCGY